jgi:hypothetical protein
MEHEWFAGIDFGKIFKKELKPPYTPDPDMDYVEPEFIEKVVTNENLASPVGSYDSYDGDLIADFDYQRSDS